MIILSVFLFLFCPYVDAHGGSQDKHGGHFDRKTNSYHCHNESCFSIQSQADRRYKTARPHSFSKLYERKSWPHWVDFDGDCQNTRHELLIATSQSPYCWW